MAFRKGHAVEVGIRLAFDLEWSCLLEIELKSSRFFWLPVQY
jgi:hypothetical protein